jgi:hypothetical protein
MQPGALPGSDYELAKIFLASMVAFLFLFVFGFLWYAKLNASRE